MTHPLALDARSSSTTHSRSRSRTVRAIARLLVTILVLSETTLLAPTPSRAQSISETGANGTNAAPAASGSDGEDGGDGESIRLTGLDQVTNISNVGATARGGRGGRGGNGGAPEGAAGDGGRGGDAEVETTIRTGPNLSPFTSTLSMSASAIAGDSGDSGTPGSPTAASGAGPDGGNATARIVGEATVGVRSVTTSARAAGGAGGDVDGTSLVAGAGGTADASAYGIATDQTLFHRVSVTAEGGSGGWGDGLENGGDGGDVFLQDAVAGEGGVTLTLEQRAVGGDAGGGGEGGDATSVLEADRAEGNLSLVVSAEGGDSSAGRGGDGRASAVATAGGDVRVDARVVAGEDRGSLGTEAAAQPAATATLGPVRGTSTGGGSVEVLGRLEAARGGASLTRASDGGDALLTNAVDADTTGAIRLLQSAIAGQGGEISRAPAGTPGTHGGDASSELVYTKNAASLDARVEATAGISFGQDESGLLIEAAHARSVADLRNEGGSVSIDYDTTGAAGTTAFVGVDRAGAGGSATSVLRATTSGDGQSIAIGADESSTVGGRGGSDLPFSDVLFAGNGGEGRTEATGIAEGDSHVDVRAFATGGVGGTGGRAFDGGTNGNGGDAIAVARGSNAGASAVEVLASATGGAGGGNQSSDRDMRGGDGGSGSAIAHGESTGGGDVTVTARVTGGRGTEGGVGGDAVVVDGASGQTTGRLRLVQEAIGGSYVSGIGGGATSSIDIRDTNAARLEVESLAVSGSGTTTGGARASASAIGANDVEVTARVRASSGIRGGAVSVGPVRGESTGGGDVVVRAEIGGDDFRGGFVGALDGGDVTIEDAVDGRTTGRLELIQRALAGAARVDPVSGLPGDAPNATNRLVRGVSAGTVDGFLESMGGTGYSEGFRSQSPATEGGAATVEAALHNDAGDLVLNAVSRGGDGGAGYAGALGGNGGLATLQVQGSTESDGRTVTIGGGPAFGAYGGQATAGTTSTNRGTPGDGGAAESHSIGLAQGNSVVDVHDRATGGAGKTGGNASSHAEGRNSGSDAVRVLAEATGGAGDVGGVGTATAYGASVTGDVAVESLMTSGRSRIDSNSTTPRGVDVEGTNQVAGSTAGVLQLTQRAIGGDVTSTGSIEARGGDARSVLDASNPGGGGLVLLAEAIGGDGDSILVSGGHAHASAQGRGTGSSSVEVVARARGGDGHPNSILPYTPSPSSGGLATLGVVRGDSDDGGAVRVRGEVYGGNGSTREGAGSDALLENAVDGSTTGFLTLEQLAVGGGGARAGTAVSRLDRSVSTERFSVVSDARGGESLGGPVTVEAIDLLGDGARAESAVRARNDGGDLEIQSIARASNGAAGFGGSRVAGGNGGNASNLAVARTVGDGRSIVVGATATGSAATSGAHAGDGSAGTAGQSLRDGSGGDASSRSEGIALGDSAVVVFDQAVGGDAVSDVGIGGSGGHATSYAHAENTGSESVRAAAVATGGDGGYLVDPEADPSDPLTARAGHAQATASGSSLSGDVDVSAIQTAGSGGGRFSSTIGRGSDGGDSVMVDAVSGSTAGQLTLLQRAQAGHGGTAALAGRGGDARSELATTNAGGGGLLATVEAEAGRGGLARGADASSGQGGDALAGGVVSSAGASPLALEIRARGGDGGGATSSAVPGDRGARGGLARVQDAIATSLGGGDVRVLVEATGGAGGGGHRSGGDGASVSLQDVARGSTTGALRLTQRARGGAAGAIRSSATDAAAGRAGDASSAFDVVTSSESLTVVGEAFAGAGAGSASTGASGGEATSTIRAVNDAGGIGLQARAVGGNVGASSTSASPVRFGGGSATVDLFAQTLGKGDDILIGDASDGIGAIGGDGGDGTRDTAGGGDASSRSVARAMAASNVVVFDRAVGGSSSGTSGLGVDGGDAFSTAIAETHAGELARANASATGGDARGGVRTDVGRSGLAVARADARGAEVAEARATSQAGRLPTFVTNGESLARSEARATGRSASTQALSAGWTGPAESFRFETHVGASASGGARVKDLALVSSTDVGGSGREAFTATANSAASIGGLTDRPGEWTRIALAVDSDVEGLDIVLEASAELDRTASRFPGPADSLSEIFVSFLDVDLDVTDFDDLTFRILSGGDALLERRFTGRDDAEVFFSSVFDLGQLGGDAPVDSVDLRFSLSSGRSSAPGRVAVYFAVGTIPVPEPGTGLLLSVGLAILGLRARREARAR